MRVAPILPVTEIAIIKMKQTTKKQLERGRNKQESRLTLGKNEVAGRNIKIY